MDLLSGKPLQNVSVGPSDGPTGRNYRFVLVLDFNDDFNLVLGMSIRRNTGDPDIVDVVQSHVQVLGDVVVRATGNEAEFVVAIVDGHSIGVEGIVRFPDQFQRSADSEVLEGLATVPVAKSGNVEVREMDILDGFLFFASHKEFSFTVKLFLFPESKVKARLHQNVGQPRQYRRKS